MRDAPVLAVLVCGLAILAMWNPLPADGAEPRPASSEVVVEPRSGDNSPTAGIQEAIDSLPPEGGLVRLAPGTYLLRRQVCLRANVTLRGAGESTRLTRPPVIVRPLAETLPAGANDLVLADTDGLQPGDQVGVWSPRPPREESWLYKGYAMRYLAIRNVGPGGRVAGEKLFGDDDKTYRVEHGAQLATIFPAIFIGEADGATVDSLVIDGQFEAEPAGRDDANFMCAAVLQHQSRRCRIQNVTVQRWNADGICLGGGSSDTLVTGCIVEHCWGIGFHPGGGIRSVRILGNVSRFNEHGLLFCQGNRNVVVSDNVIHNNRHYGIWGLGHPDRYCVVANNCCFENGWHGIEAWQSVGNVIQGNICRNNSQAEPGRYAGIFLSEHADNVVTGNLCLDDQDRPTQWRGLEAVNPAGPNVIEHNSSRPYGPGKDAR